jgi:hypothetical protein
LFSTPTKPTLFSDVGMTISARMRIDVSSLIRPGVRVQMWSRVRSTHVFCTLSSRLHWSQVCTTKSSFIEPDIETELAPRWRVWSSACSWISHCQCVVYSVLYTPLIVPVHAPSVNKNDLPRSQPLLTKGPTHSPARPLCSLAFPGSLQFYLAASYPKVPTVPPQYGVGMMEGFGSPSSPACGPWPQGVSLRRRSRWCQQPFRVEDVIPGYILT